MGVIATAISRNRILIRLTDERWSHITEAHDYMAGNLDCVLESIEDPDYIVAGPLGELIALKRYQKTNISRKTAVVVYREGEPEGFVITPFMTSKELKILRRGALLWKKR